jgi:CRP-like cAMP-binding protein
MSAPVQGTSSQTVVGGLFQALRRHSQLSTSDERAIASLRPRVRVVPPVTDIVRQGDRCDVSIFVLKGTVARYHTLANGNRQYLSLHIPGDWPDLQALFLEMMDHSLTSLDEAEIASFTHEELKQLFIRAPDVGFAMWRQTLLDAAIFRAAITNNGARPHVERLAHLFCEHLVRTHAAGLSDGRSCSFPLNQLQVGQMLGMSLVSVNRALQTLRRERCAELRSGTLTSPSRSRLSKRAGFDDGYLHFDLCAAPMTPRRR